MGLCMASSAEGPTNEERTYLANGCDAFRISKSVDAFEIFLCHIPLHFKVVWFVRVHFKLPFKLDDREILRGLLFSLPCQYASSDTLTALCIILLPDIPRLLSPLNLKTIMICQFSYKIHVLPTHTLYSFRQLPRQFWFILIYIHQPHSTIPPLSLHTCISVSFLSTSSLPCPPH